MTRLGAIGRCHDAAVARALARTGAALLLMAGVAMAAEGGGAIKRPSPTDTKGVRDNPLTKDLTAPGNGGVAGTGLGGTDHDAPLGGASGTGGSVKGPAGQGIKGQGTGGGAP